MANKLALLGGEPIRKKLFPAYNTIGNEEKIAVQKVLDSGNLSQFLGAWHEDFFGGPFVRAFEERWAEFCQTKFAISVNSNTSGLIASMGAIGIRPGDEVIVSPYTMSASAIAPIVYGGVPVFADIDPDTFCISASTIEKVITPRTKAILVVHIFGQSADMDPILELAKKHKLYVIEDAAQAPGGTYKGRSIGNLGDIGVFSLNYHKHIHTGEGGIMTTNNAELAERLRLIRNHGENIVEPMNFSGDRANTWGFNFRLPEMEAAIGIEQLKKLPRLLEERIQIAQEFDNRFSQYNGLTPPRVLNDVKHCYYLYATKFDEQKVGISRDIFIKAIRAELPTSELRETNHLINGGYVRPLYLQPFYQQRLATCSFNCEKFKGTVNYEKGLCPSAEKMHFKEIFTHEFMRPSMKESDLRDVFNAFEKVLSQVSSLQQWSEK